MPMKNALFLKMRSFELVMQFVLMQRTAKKDRKAKQNHFVYLRCVYFFLGPNIGAPMFEPVRRTLAAFWIFWTKSMPG
jgi:hypothetical protein